MDAGIKQWRSEYLRDTNGNVAHDHYGEHGLAGRVQEYCVPRSDSVYCREPNGEWAMA